MGIDKSPLFSSPEDALSNLPSVRASLPYYYADRANMLWQKGAQIGLSGLVRHIGVSSTETFAAILRGIEVPEYSLVSWSDAYPDAKQMPSGTFAEIAKDAGVKLLAEGMRAAGIEIAGKLAQIVPVVGWAVGAIIQTGQVVAQAVHAQRLADMPAFDRPATFRPGQDIFLYNQVCQPALESGDWTNIWLTPGFMGDLVGTKGPFTLVLEKEEDKDGAKVSTAITARKGNFWWQEAGGTGAVAGGMIPGTLNLHQGIDLLPGGKIRDWGDLMPTLRKQASWMWSGYVSQQSEQAMFSVRADVIADEWRGYLLFLRRMLDGDFGGFERIVSFDKRKNCRSALSKSRCDGRHGKVFTKKDAKKIIDFYADPAWFGWSKDNGTDSNPYGIDDSTPVRAAEDLRRRQFGALDTLTVAYLTEDLAALSDPELRERWQQRRADLLHHPARCLVDLDSVPYHEDGGIWKERLVRSGVGSPTCEMGGVLRAPEAKQRGDFVACEEPPTPKGVNAVATPATTPGGRRTGGGVVLLGAAALAALTLGKK
jgi:hypothetical protein